MKKRILITCACLLAADLTWAHSPLLYVEDNYDGTIAVEGGFSNGDSASGLPVLIVEDKPYKGPEKSFEGKKVLFETVFDDYEREEWLAAIEERSEELGDWKEFILGEK